MYPITFEVHSTYIRTAVHVVLSICILYKVLFTEELVFCSTISFHMQLLAVFSVDCHLVMVERLACPNDPPSYVIWSLALLVGSPLVNRSVIRDWTKQGPNSNSSSQRRKESCLMVVKVDKGCSRVEATGRLGLPLPPNSDPPPVKFRVVAFCTPASPR